MTQNFESILLGFDQWPGRYRQLSRMFGYQDAEGIWDGPFIQSNGEPDMAAIRKQLAEPGSVVPEDASPEGIIADLRRQHSPPPPRAPETAADAMDWEEDIVVTLTAGMMLGEILLNVPEASGDDVQRIADEEGLQVLTPVRRPPPRRRESVSELLALSAPDDPQLCLFVARAYGRQVHEDRDDWAGVFFNEHGLPDEQKILQEVAEPGSVLPRGFRTPDEVARAEREAKAKADEERIAEAAQKALLDHRAARARLVPQALQDIEATIKTELEAGATIVTQLLLNIPGSTETMVRAVADRLNIRVYSNPEEYLEGTPVRPTPQQIQHQQFLDSMQAQI